MQQQPGLVFLNRPHREESHVVPCVCGGSQRVYPPHWHKPDQPVIPWTHTVGHTQIQWIFWNEILQELNIGSYCLILGFSYIGGSYYSCSVQIRGVKLSDAGQYHFRFETDQPLGRWTSPDTITLDVTGRGWCTGVTQSIVLCMNHLCVYVCSDLQVQVHPARPANMFGFGETVFVGCQARGCAAPGRSLALYRCGSRHVHSAYVLCLLHCNCDVTRLHAGMD